MSNSINERQGKLKFYNKEIILLLKKNNWQCVRCNTNLIDNDGDTFSQKHRKNPDWWLDFEEFSLGLETDINVKRKKPRSTKDSSARNNDGNLNYDNLLLLCRTCYENQSTGREVSISFRTSKGKKQLLETIASDEDISLTELLNKITDEYYGDNPAGKSILNRLSEAS